MIPPKSPGCQQLKRTETWAHNPGHLPGGHTSVPAVGALRMYTHGGQTCHILSKSRNLIFTKKSSIKKPPIQNQSPTDTESCCTPENVRRQWYLDLKTSLLNNATSLHYFTGYRMNKICWQAGPRPQVTTPPPLQDGVIRQHMRRGQALTAEIRSPDAVFPVHSQLT